MGVMCGLIDVSAFQASVYWHRALLEAIWMDKYMDDWAPQILPATPTTSTMQALVQTKM
jgi:hypothetical protein